MNATPEIGREGGMGRGEITCTKSSRSKNLEDLLVRLDPLPVCFDKSSRPEPGPAAILGCFGLMSPTCPKVRWSRRIHHHEALLDVDHILGERNEGGLHTTRPGPSPPD